MTNRLLDTREAGSAFTDAQEAAYYGAPSQANHVTPKKMAMLSKAGVDVSLYDGIAEAYKAIKDAEIVEPQADAQKAQQIEIKAFFNAAKETVLTEIMKAIQKKFGISYDWHYVTLHNTTGTRFVRVFWYMNGSIVSLQKIQEKVLQFIGAWEKRDALLADINNDSIAGAERLGRAKELRDVSEYLFGGK